MGFSSPGGPNLADLTTQIGEAPEGFPKPVLESQEFFGPCFSGSNAPFATVPGVLAREMQLPPSSRAVAAVDEWRRQHEAAREPLFKRWRVVRRGKEETDDGRGCGDYV
jgi:hypothetical protein